MQTGDNESLELANTIDGDVEDGDVEDDLLSFGASAGEDEPWDEFDADDLPEQDEMVSFGGPVELEDTSTFERWLQSALKALGAVEVGVDGQLGPRTRRALKAFQTRARLAADGVPGPRTIAELEIQTQSTAPGQGRAGPAEATHVTEVTEVAPAAGGAPAEPLAPGTWTVEQQIVKGVVHHVVSDGRDKVSFAYMQPGNKHAKDAFCTCNYAGSKGRQVSDADLAAAGFGPSELKILWANAKKEAGGKFGILNTWDNQLVSWGIAQFAGHAGTLAALMADLKEDPRTRAAFDHFFGESGIDVGYGPYPWKDTTKTGNHVVVRADGKVLRGDDGWKYIRTQPRLLGAFLLAGNDAALQLGQLVFWRRVILVKAIGKIVGKHGGRKGAPVSDFLTSERGLAIIVRLCNWMPKYVVEWTERFLGELASKYGDHVHDPGTWDVATDLEQAFVELVSNERKRVKSGSYDKYALDLSRERGSFVKVRHGAA